MVGCRLVEVKSESYGEKYGYQLMKHKHFHRDAASALRKFDSSDKRRRSENKISINVMNDFHLVSSILDVDIIPSTLRRVHLVRTPGKQFGLHIRSGESQYYTKSGYETVPAFFISRLADDGIAAQTGLLAVNDEIIEVNGIEVFGKSIDQVKDMMVANSSNLIITIRPSDQSMCLAPKYLNFRDSTMAAPYMYDPGQRGAAGEPNVTDVTMPQPIQKTSNGASQIYVEEDESDSEMNSGLITI